MDRQVLKGLVLTLKAIVEDLEAEVFSDTSAYTSTRNTDYDEVFTDGDDDGYPD
jgi:hypothetical protein